MVASVGFPVTGTYGIEQSEQLVNALVNIASRRPKFEAFLLKMADGSDVFTIVQITMGMMVAMQVDQQRVDPHSMLPKVTGVERVWAELNATEEFAAGSDGQPGFGQSAPFSFYSPIRTDGENPVH